MTEKIERQHGMVTPNIILSFFFLAECTSVCVCVCVCAYGSAYTSIVLGLTEVNTANAQTITDDPHTLRRRALTAHSCSKPRAL